jgi:hypothetical protein
VVTKPPYDEDKKKRSEKRGKGRSLARDAGFDGNLEDLELLPMDDEPNLQVDDIQNYGVRILAEYSETTSLSLFRVSL